MGLAALSLALGYRVGLDWRFNSADPVASFVYFAPKHALAFIVVLLVWHLAGRLTGRTADTDGRVGETKAAAQQSTLLVTRGATECLIDIEQIDAVTAAGHYVELTCGDQQYLLRSTLKQLEQLLPPGRFVRIHRSHMVDIRSIASIQSTSAGNGTVVLDSGAQLPLSKSCRKALKQQTCLPA